MRRMLLFLAMLAVAVAPALAEDRPLVRPNRDVAVEYRSSGTPQGPAAEPGREVTMRFASRSGRIRIDGPNGRGYAILDIDAGRMTVVMTERRLYMEQPADPGMTAMFQAANAAYTKTGTDTVAGLACTTYEARISDRKGQVCLTDDGVLLRARNEDPNRRRELEAMKVTYGDQPASLFEAPAGFQKLDPAAMSRGMNTGPDGH
jgi:hypothetical protein